MVKNMNEHTERALINVLEGMNDLIKGCEEVIDKKAKASTIQIYAGIGALAASVQCLARLHQELLTKQEKQ